MAFPKDKSVHVGGARPSWCPWCPRGSGRAAPQPSPPCGRGRPGRWGWSSWQSLQPTLGSIFFPTVYVYTFNISKLVQLFDDKICEDFLKNIHPCLRCSWRTNSSRYLTVRGSLSNMEILIDFPPDLLSESPTVKHTGADRWNLQGFDIENTLKVCRHPVLQEHTHCRGFELVNNMNWNGEVEFSHLHQGQPVKTLLAGLHVPGSEGRVYLAGGDVTATHVCSLQQFYGVTITTQ